MIGGQVLELEGENEKKEGIDREIGIEGEWEGKGMDKGINKKEKRRQSERERMTNCWMEMNPH